MLRPTGVDQHLSAIETMDWLSKHEYVIRLLRRAPAVANAIVKRLSPDQLLWGKHTAQVADPAAPIPLPPKQKRQSLITEYFTVVKRPRT
jgi:hypothetical protein